MTKKQKKMLKRIITAAAGFILLNLISHFAVINEKKIEALFYGIPVFLCYLAIYLIIASDILKKAFKGILNRQVFDENFLMAAASLGAFALAVYTKSGDYNEAVVVMIFYQTGEFFQGIAVGKSRQNISALMDIRPDYANLEKDGKIEQVSPDTVKTGTVIIVKPGEKVPIDGFIIEGKSTLNTSALTGESLPREVTEGDEIISGCINLSGLLKIRTSREFGESTVSKILELVENSTSRKSKSENFISKFAKVYTPVVCYSALALAILPPLFAVLVTKNQPLWNQWIYRALTFLVISCPCALVISIPLSFFAGIGGASREGILIKGSNYMETLSKVKTVVFDKTGTLTKGVFNVSALHHVPSETTESKIIEYAALAESSSNHPISKSLQTAYEKEIDRSRITDLQEISGKGIIARVDGKEVAIGNEKLMQQLGIEAAACHSTGTIVHIALEKKYAGHIVISDEIKAESKKAVSLLKKCGVEKTVMLTGDGDKIAQAVGKELGLSEVFSELLPAGKVSKVEELLENDLCRKGGKLAFVGDGINDAPVLSRADVGIAMGAMGSDAAIEAADVVLMDDNPVKIAQAIKISRKCLGIVYQNIVFALGIKFACLILGAMGIANMWLAIFADVGVMILAILNAIRALSVKKI